MSDVPFYTDFFKIFAKEAMIYYNEQCMLSMSHTKEKQKNFGQQGQPIVCNWKEMGTILGNNFLLWLISIHDKYTNSI